MPKVQSGPLYGQMRRCLRHSVDRACHKDQGLTPVPHGESCLPPSNVEQIRQSLPAGWKMGGCCNAVCPASDSSMHPFGSLSIRAFPNGGGKSESSSSNHQIRMGQHLNTQRRADAAGSGTALR